MNDARGTRREISVDDGTFACYHAGPVESQAQGGIVLLQEIFGTNQHIRELADQWAEEGFEVLVPDLFWRIEPGVELGYDGWDLDRAREMYGQLDWALAESDVRACAETLRSGNPGRVFVLGFCFGGKLATICATRDWIDRAVGYYGVGIEKLNIASGVACPLMLHFGAEDKGTPPDAIDVLREQLPDASDVYVYDGAGHGFNNWRKAIFNAPQSQRAFARTAAFLKAG